MPDIIFKEIVSIKVPKGKLLQAPQFKTTDSGHIGVSASNVGSFLFSNAFANCQAVVAAFTDGNFGLFHAASAAESIFFSTFVRQIKTYEKKQRTSLEDIYVFRKETNKNNMHKGPMLSKFFSKAFQGKEVKLVQLADYKAIVCDSKKKSIILCSDMIIEYGKNTKSVIGKIELKKVEIELKKKTEIELKKKADIEFKEKSSDKSSGLDFKEKSSDKSSGLDFKEKSSDESSGLDFKEKSSDESSGLDFKIDMEKHCISITEKEDAISSPEHTRTLFNKY